MKEFTDNLKETLKNLGFSKSSPITGQPESSVGYKISYYSHQALPNYRFSLCEDIGKYYVIFKKKKNDDYGEITYKRPLLKKTLKGKSISLCLSGTMKSIYESRFEKIYYDILGSIESDTSLNLFEKGSVGLSHLSQEEIKDYLFLVRLEKKLREDPISAFMFAIWYSKILEFVRSVIPAHEVLGIIPKTTQLHLTAPKHYKIVLKCKSCDNIFISDGDFIVSPSQKCEICSSGASKGERVINKLIRYVFIPNCEVISYKREYVLPNGQRLDFLLEYKSKDKGIRSFGIEFDGEYHLTSENIKRDLEKQELCDSMDITMVRVRTKSVSTKIKRSLLDTSNPDYHNIQVIDKSSILIDNFEKDIEEIFYLGSGSKSGNPSYDLTRFSDDSSRFNHIIKIFEE